jgi:hypothetical protein
MVGRVVDFLCGMSTRSAFAVDLRRVRVSRGNSYTEPAESEPPLRLRCASAPPSIAESTPAWARTHCHRVESGFPASCLARRTVASDDEIGVRIPKVGNPHRTLLSAQ